MKSLTIIIYLAWLCLLPNFVLGLASQPLPLCTISQIYQPNDILSIHIAANPLSKKIGTIHHNGNPIQKLGEASVNNSTWYKVSYQKITGWVNAQGLLCFLSPENAKQAIGKHTEQVIQAIKKQDFIQWAAYVHPNKGVRFSPYASVEPEIDLVFTMSQLKNLVNDSKKLIWGRYDGSGEPILLNFYEYYNRFIYDHDFANAPKVVYNTIIISGNTRNNMREIYPNASIVEYHFPGFNPDFKGDDWSSLRLVFEQFNKNWYLVGIIHDQWTI